MIRTITRRLDGTTVSDRSPSPSPQREITSDLEAQQQNSEELDLLQVAIREVEIDEAPREGEKDKSLKKLFSLWRGRIAKRRAKVKDKVEDGKAGADQETSSPSSRQKVKDEVGPDSKSHNYGCEYCGCWHPQSPFPFPDCRFCG